MKLEDFVQHPLDHSGLTNVEEDQHHLSPQNIEVSNTTLTVEPLPGGPGIWDIAVPYEASVVMFNFRSALTIALGGGKGGVTGIACEYSTKASVASFSGEFPPSQYNAIYAKPAASANLSHKQFSSAGGHIALSDIHLYAISGTEKVLRTVWTNYGSSVYTLNVWGEVHVIG